MTIELIGAILFFVFSVFALLFTLTKVSHVGGENFPNRGRFYIGLSIWVLTAILAVFMSFPGYPEWFVPAVYPILKISFLVMFLVGFFMVLTTLIAFPLHLEIHRREIDGRSDRIALLENIRQIASQPYPIPELFALVLKELGSFLGVGKGAIFLINPSRREMYLAAYIGLDKSELGRLERFPIGRDMISQAANEQEPYVSGDLGTADSATRKLILAGRDISLSAAAIPLSIRDRSLGTLLVLSDKPYRFEKRDRMLLHAASEAVAGVVETNRLGRENQKLARQIDDGASKLGLLRAGLARRAKHDDFRQSLAAICRYVVEHYRLTAGRVISIAEGDITEVVGFETKPAGRQSESFRIAVINAVRQGKTVVLNQEAKDAGGNAYISRSVLICPLAGRTGGEYALLLEAPGNGLPLTNDFLADLDGIQALLTIDLESEVRGESGRMDNAVTVALLNILRLNYNEPAEAVYRRFLDEIAAILPPESSAVAAVREDASGYRIAAGRPALNDEVSTALFQPGEGPIGKALATGQVGEYASSATVETSWNDLDPANQDFLNRLFGEQGIPGYQLCVPVGVLDNFAAAIAVFGHGQDMSSMAKTKGPVLLAVQLLSIKLSMAQLGRKRVSLETSFPTADTGAVLNRINNDLATIIGRAQLLQQQPDMGGPARYTADEILKAAEQAAETVREMQKDMAVQERPAEKSGLDLNGDIERFLQRRHVTGNLYMFDDNRAVMLQKELVEPCPIAPQNDRLNLLIEAALRQFVTMLDEGDEVMLKSEIRGGYFYLSLIRGARDAHRRFDPTTRDFGDPDVLPRDIISEELLKVLADDKGEASFDRFGRRPTYLSFRFPVEDASHEVSETAPASALAGLKILAIDDQQMILDLLSGICQSLGLELAAVRDPSEGLALFGQQRFDMVMVDLAIGRVSGWDIAREIKRKSPETPVIMLTGWGVDIAQDKADGSIDYALAKPFRIEQLTEIISRAGSRHISS